MTNEKLSLLNKWKQKAEELRVQLHLGGKDALEKFNEDKRQIATWAKESKTEFSKFTSENVTALKTRMEELELQAALAKAETKDEILEQRAELNRALENAQVEVNKFKSNASTEVKDLAHRTEEKLDDWRSKFDLLKLQLHLGAMDADKEWEEKKRELGGKLDELETKLSKAREDGSKTVQNVKEDITDAWKSVKAKFAKD